MTSTAATPVSPRPEDWVTPDCLDDPGAQFAVEWQVVEHIPWYTGSTPVDVNNLS